MDRRRAETISSLLLLVLVVISIVGFGRYYFVTRTIDRIQLEDARRIIGSDKVLLETVTELESNLRERIAYQFVVNKDPLDLTKVITDEDFLAKLGADKVDPDAGVMRLAATIVGDRETAAIVIRYLGNEHRLRLGDRIEGWTVAEVTPQRAVLTKGGRRRVLENRPARENVKSGLNLSASPSQTDTGR